MKLSEPAIVKHLGYIYWYSAALQIEAKNSQFFLNQYGSLQCQRNGSIFVGANTFSDTFNKLILPVKMANPDLGLYIADIGEA